MTQDLAIIQEKIIQDSIEVKNDTEKTKFTIHPHKEHILTESVKNQLKSNKCHYEDFYRAYICPINSKQFVRDLLEKNKIKADLKDVKDSSPNKDQKTISLDSQRCILEREIKKNDEALRVAIYNYDRTLSISHFNEPPKMENYPGDESQDTKESRYSIEMDFHERQLAINKDKKKLKELIERFNNHEKDLETHPTNSSYFLFDLITKSLMRNERGDAELFSMLFKGKYLFDFSEGRSGEFYFWEGSHWKIDRDKQRYRDIEVVSDYYEKASIQIGKNSSEDTGKNDEKAKLKNMLSKRAFDLRSTKRCRAVFEFVANEIPLKDEWDHCPGLLPCSNGIIDLQTGKLIENKPEYFIRSICPTKYDPQAKCPLFNKFLDDITLGDIELRGFLGRILGSALIGDSREEMVFILYGKGGRNGKGTLMQTLEKILGPLAKTFPSEMILEQRNPPSSSTPRPEKANLQGTRFAIFSEINENRKIDAAEIKNLSGRDTIPCRKLYSNTTIQIRPSHTMFIQTNYKPKSSSKDGALWKRYVLFSFNADFVLCPKKPHERQLDTEFKSKLLNEKEGILTWLVEGALEYQKIGLSIPANIRSATEDYRKENDGIERFLSEVCIEAPEFSTPKSKMEQSIKEFCKENTCEIPTRNEISKTLKEKYGEGRTGSCNIWKGVKIVDEMEIQS